MQIDVPEEVIAENLEAREAILTKCRRRGMTNEQIEQHFARIISHSMKRFLLWRRAKRASEKQSILDRDHLREFWNTLTGHGLVFLKQRRSGGRPVRRVMWIDEELWRLLIGTTRSYHRKDLSGLFLLDVSGIWVGCRTPAFKRLPAGSRDPDLCMSLIGSERTIDMVFSSTQERTAMYQRFKLLLRMIHEKAEEKRVSQYKNLAQMKKPNATGIGRLTSALVLKRRLLNPQGILVTYVLPGARKVPRILRLVGNYLVPAKLTLDELEALEEDNDLDRGSIIRRTRSLRRKLSFNSSKAVAAAAAQEREEMRAAQKDTVTAPRRFSVSGMLRRARNHMMDEEDTENEEGVPYGCDIREMLDCRPGMYSPVFADLITAVKQQIKFYGGDKKQLTELERHTATVVGADRTLSLEFPKQKSRDEFVIWMKSLIELVKLDDRQLIEALLRPSRPGGAADHDG